MPLDSNFEAGRTTILNSNDRVMMIIFNTNSEGRTVMALNSNGKGG